jgi:hypothetical protein
VRSAELVWVAQPIACCGGIGGVGLRGETAQRRVRTPLIVIADPVRDRCPRMSEAEEEGFVKKLIPHPPLKLSQKPFYGLARRDEVPGNLVLLRPGEHGVRCKLSPVVRDDHPRLAVPFDQRGPFARHAPPRDGGVGDRREGFRRRSARTSVRPIDVLNALSGFGSCAATQSRPARFSR